MAGLVELDSLSLDDVERANRALDAWDDAERRLIKRMKEKK